jgi:hypothetical protein
MRRGFVFPNQFCESNPANYAARYTPIFINL